MPLSVHPLEEAFLFYLSRKIVCRKLPRNFVQLVHYNMAWIYLPVLHSHQL